MSAIEAIREKLPEAAKDLKLNLQAVLRPENLTGEQVWGVACASAYFIGSMELRDAMLSGAREAQVSEDMIDDARAAAALMGMNTTFYRFRHLVEKESYGKIPARLRMTRMGSPRTSKASFELMSMACAALAGCGMCIQAHEATLRQHEVSEAAINDAVRIAAVLQGVAVAMNLDTPVAVA